MKIDMHCHTKEGSIDAKVNIETYIKTLISKGFDGMLITDHNSYKGFEYWKNVLSKMNFQKPFVVLKGIEYDTKDAGHTIVIMPDKLPKNTQKICDKLLQTRGMTILQLEKIVHSLGGILGPAHPFGTGYFAFMNTHFGKKHPKMLKKFDFVETFNSCAKPLANIRAKHLAKRLHIAETAGSDAHIPEVIGSAFTEFSQTIKNNNDLIAAIKSRQKPQVPYKQLINMYKDKNIVVEKFGIIGYWIYNRLAAFRVVLRRKKHYSFFRL